MQHFSAIADFRDRWRVAHRLHGTPRVLYVDAARARGVGLAGLSEHRIEPGPPALLLGYGRIAEPAIESAVRALADSLRP